MRKFLTFIVYTALILIIGRNLAFLPKFYLFSSKLEHEQTFTQNLKKQTTSIIKQAKGNYSVFYYDFNNSQNTFGIDAHEIYTAASVNKVPIVAVLYYLNNKGKIDLDDTIVLQEADIQDYGTGSLRYQKPGTVYSIKTLAKLALKQSDNTAAHILAERIGMDVIQETINSWGLRQTNMDDNKTTVYDMYLLYKRIYDGKIASVARTRELFGFMQDTDIEDRLPALLPSSIDVYHKTGDATGSYHDVGIIKDDNNVFFLGILTSDNQDDGGDAKESIAKVAKMVVDEYGRKE
jgi:beta-lactamase class A